MFAHFHAPKSLSISKLVLHPFLGLTVAVVAVVMAVFFTDETVKNDANIGAGILLLAGLAQMIVAASHHYAQRGAMDSTE